jgi:phosphate transport system permease protein
VPVPMWQAFSAYLFGRQWLTASFWQDWYGVLPLFIGSLMVSLVALSLAVPLGVGAAIYVNQIASLREQRFIKPCIEFISAIPSVVLGFFGIAVLGQALRALSQVTWLSWVPGFPYSERLNILTAGCLLALIAVPTIFTLAEDALNNVAAADDREDHRPGLALRHRLRGVAGPRPGDR